MANVDYKETAQLAKMAASTATRAAAALDYMATGLEQGNLVMAIEGLVRAMGEFSILEADLVRVRDAGLVATASVKPVGQA